MLIDTNFTSELENFYRLANSLRTHKEFGPSTSCNEGFFEIKGFQNPNKVLTLSALIHGNETVGILIFNRLLEKILGQRIKSEVTLRLVLGNIDAAKVDKRFLEIDLNRSFGCENPELKEELLALEIVKKIKGSHYHIDIHQTTAACLRPFFIFNQSKENLDWARSLNPDFPSVVFDKSGFHGKGTALSSHINETFKIPSITVELGEKGFISDQVEFGLKMIDRALDLASLTNLPSPRGSQPPKIYTWGQTVENFDGSLKPVEGLVNFQKISAGETLATSFEGEPFKEVKAFDDGLVLFPKYAPLGEKSPELVRVLKAFDLDEM